MTTAKFLMIAALAAFGVGCQKKPEAVAQTPPAASPSSTAEEPRVHNAFTDHVDQGVTTMHKAETARDAMNQNTRQTEQAAKDVGAENP